MLLSALALSRIPPASIGPTLSPSYGICRDTTTTRVNHVELSDPTFKQSTQRRREFTQVQAARRLKSLLLHVWIEVFIMVWLTMVVSGVYPAGWRPEVDDEQILPRGDHLSLYILSPS